MLPHHRQGNVTLHIHSSRTGDPARRQTVRKMIGQQQLQRRFAGGLNLGVAGFDHHAISDFGGAGREQVWNSLHLHNTDKTRRERLQLGVVAQMRYLDPLAFCHAGNSFAGIGFNPVAVNLNFHAGHGIIAVRNRTNRSLIIKSRLQTGPAEGLAH